MFCPKTMSQGALKQCAPQGWYQESRQLQLKLLRSRLSLFQIKISDREIILNNYLGVILMLSPSVSHKIYLLLILLRWPLPDKFLGVGKLVFKERD